MNFQDWYASNVAPQVEEQLKSVPADARPLIRKASRDAMAACWNAATEEAKQQHQREKAADLSFSDAIKVKP